MSKFVVKEIKHPSGHIDRNHIHIGSVIHFVEDEAEKFKLGMSITNLLELSLTNMVKVNLKIV